MSELNVELAREALRDWRAGKLSSDAALFALSLIIDKQRPPTAEEIEYAKTLEPEALKALGENSDV